MNQNTFHGNSTNIQIQQNTTNSSQTIAEGIDFEKVSKIFSQIRGNMDSLGNSDAERKKIEDTLNEVQTNVDSKTEPSRVRKALSIIKDILINSSGSLAASGILYLISGVLT